MSTYMDTIFKNYWPPFIRREVFPGDKFVTVYSHRLLSKQTSLLSYIVSDEKTFHACISVNYANHFTLAVPEVGSKAV